MTAQEEWAADLADHIDEIGGIRPAKHVLARLAALLYPRKWEYIDVNFLTEQWEVHGHIVVFTEDLLVLTTISKMNALGTSPSDPHKGSDATVRVLPRRALEQLEIAPLDGPLQLNSTPEWQLNSGKLTDWPSAGRVALRYRGLAEPLILPAANKPEGFQAFLPNLLADLTR